MADAYVFPGGSLEPMDESFPPHLVDRVDAPDLDLRVAAIRETFEECGVLLATDSDGRHPTAARLRSMGADEARGRLNDLGDDWDWSEWVAHHDLTLEVSKLGFQARWITPVVEPRRFDTRFYVAAVPREQDARHDGVEATDSAWIRPEAAMAAAHRREALIVPPTLKNLEALLGFGTAEELVAAAHASPDPTPIMPTMVFREDGVWVTHESFEPMWGREA